MSAIKAELIDINNTFCNIAQSPQAFGINEAAPEHKDSVINLLQYLWLRQYDLTALQDELHNLGLSSLASSESHIHHQVQNIMTWLNIPATGTKAKDANYCSRLLRKHSQALFGEHSSDEGSWLMVTLDGKWKEDIAKMERLLMHGMDVARINCAHDDEKTWKALVESLNIAMENTNKKCKIYMDLAGPKFRTILGGKYGKEGLMKIKKGETITFVDLPQEMAAQKGKALSAGINHISQMLKPGMEVLFDDGNVRSVVSQVVPGEAMLTIVSISGKPQLKAGKGITFPGITLQVNSLTPADIEAIPFVRKYADLVGYSYVRTAEDLQQLQALLYPDKEDGPAIIIKIETPQAVKHLPELLLCGMRRPHFGVMIARGDLAVEIGFERLGEIQEEIMWICEAAHTPVIWATQVLESMNKTGLATRSEITDAYKAAQAECIMVNKGQHTESVIATLKDLAKRSKRHHIKKRYAMGSLGISRQFFHGNNHAAPSHPGKRP